MSNDNVYDETSIKVLNMKEIEDRFSYHRVQVLAQKYGVDVNWLNRLFTACQLAGVNPDEYAVPKYLDKKDIPVNKDVSEIHSELTEEHFKKKQR